ncbi:MAG TPA: hypothetical protein EYQ43_10350 [Methyloprofundus sp.]|uniref:hypothetical protein n=1 Tax=Methyloprofundus sp. TaxID=2020875 RepID=UPI0018589B67|nr:hypothetical protein [Methyloprofundus sp.]HIG65926.1 hypothetical protein [Methyloprofundus sp.]HIL78979.1 hypothetical protein [Methylococcales bacterium]
MQTTYFLQKKIVNRVSNDDEYLGVDAMISPQIIDLMGLQQKTIASQNPARSAVYRIKLDEYEFAMAS